MKKTIVFLLTAALTVSLAACGGAPTQPETEAPTGTADDAVTEIAADGETQTAADDAAQAADATGNVPANPDDAVSNVPEPQTDLPATAQTDATAAQETKPEENTPDVTAADPFEGPNGAPDESPTQEGPTEVYTTLPREWKHATLKAAWAENSTVKGAIQITLSADEPVSRLILTTDEAVRDLKLLDLKNPSVSSEGKMSFSTAVRYDLGEFSPERPLEIALTFYGDTPTTGISYTDETGRTRTFALDVSGMDGSPYLWEF